ncbi:hypothetical protein AZE42_08695 [Rhizopogon vesiculosus]|uniref:Uncharacterized protein n=1 Tax=Rhizopogon vesiculosus TaxID=180088 RepID=A0A1J8QLK5_9AGAM|nr:hypothetical protein AZE42_08695 [Rhizopogon vesiculosus]
MEHVIAIAAGLVLRTVIDFLTDNNHMLTSASCILIGLWEGIMLSHFLQKNPRDSNDAYLALTTRFAIDFLLTSSVFRFGLTGVWTVIGLLLADLSPTVWRQTGLRHVYNALRKDVKAMRRAAPQWRIENDINIPSISISNPVPGLFSRPPPSTIVSSTRAAPPTSPAPVPNRRSALGSSSSAVTISDINTLTREVIPGPSPALIPTADNPASFDPADSYSQRTSLLSDSGNTDPSRLDPILIPDAQEQEQVYEPELSALDISPPIAAVQVTIANVEIISPTPITTIRALPPISDIDISVPAHNVPLPPSRPASRVNTAVTTSPWRRNIRAHAEKSGSDISADFGKAYMTQGHQRASSTGVMGHGHHLVDNRSSSTGHQRVDSGARRLEHSTLRPSEESWRRGVGEPVVDGGTMKEPILSGTSETESFVGGFVSPAGTQMPQHSGIPGERSGGARTNSALGLIATLPPSKAPTPPPKPISTTPAPYVKQPTPVPQTRLTTPAPHPTSEKAGLASKAPTTAPPSKTTTPRPLTTPASHPASEKAGLASKAPTTAPPSKTTTPKPPTPDPTSATNRTSVPPTDYNPAEPVRPMPGLKSPSTEPDSIFGGPTRRPYGSGEFDTIGDDIEDPPPPFKEFESPVNAQGDGLGETDGRGAQGDGPQVVADENVEQVGEVGVQEAGNGIQGGDGTQGRGETSQDAGEHTQSPGNNAAELEENAREKSGDSQGQEKSKQEETKDHQGAGHDNQGADNDSQAAGKVSQVADEGAPVVGEGAPVASGDTQVADPPTATLLTPEQKEAETHRMAFLRKELARIGSSNLVSEGTSPQDRVDVLKERIARTIFAGELMLHSRPFFFHLHSCVPNKDPPAHLPIAPELSTTGSSSLETLNQLTDMIVDLLIERQDAGSVQVRVSSSSKTKHKGADKVLKVFITE